MSRKLDNWLHSFLDWTLPRSESPESLILWTGLFSMSSVVKRHVCFPRSIMGMYDIYPNLYVLLVGPAGVVRKSTTLNAAQSLIMDLYRNDIEKEVTLASTAMSVSKMIEMLASSYDDSLAIISSEFSNFVMTSQEEMFDVLTDLYDSPKRYEYGTRMHGYEVADEPCVNLLGATTPSWLATVPEYLTGGGFARRVIFVFEDTVRQRKLYYDIDWPKFEGLKSDLQHDLAHIASIKGDFKHDTKKTKDTMEMWYHENAESLERDERVEGYFQTKHVHIHKIAMLLSLAEDDELVITMDHFEMALGVLEKTEEKMTRALASVGRNPYSSHLDQIQHFIESFHGKEVSRKQVLRRFYHDLKETEVDEQLATLVAMGKIRVIKKPGQGPGSRSYRAVK